MEDPTYRDMFNNIPYKISPQTVHFIQTDSDGELALGELPAKDVSEWITKGERLEGDAGPRRIRILIAMDSRDDEHCEFHLSSKDQQLLFHTWKLPQAAYRMSYGIAGEVYGPSLVLLRSDRPEAESCFGVLYQSRRLQRSHVNIALVYNGRESTLRAFCYGFDEEPSTKGSSPTELINWCYKHLKAFATYPAHPLILPIILHHAFQLRLSLEADAKMGEIYTAESKSGYHSWDDLEERTYAEPNLAEIIKSLSTLASNCEEQAIRVEAYLGITEDMLQACREASKWLKSIDSPTTDADNTKNIDDVTLKMCEELQITKWMCRRTLETYRVVTRKTEVLLSTLSRLTAQRVASDTKQDSASMKTIALLTLFFLPGTAIASFFSMTMFDWGTATRSPPSVSPWLGLYFGITFIITTAVVTTWTLLTNPLEYRRVTRRLELLSGIKTGSY